MFWFRVLALLFRGHFLLFIGLRYHAKVYSMSTSESGGPVHLYSFLQLRALSSGNL